MEAQKENQVKKENSLVIKDNSLIQISRLSMNLNEMKAFSFIIAHIPDFSNDKLDVIVFNKSEFRRALDLEYKGNNTHIKATLKKLIQRVVEIQTDKIWRAFPILIDVALEENGENIQVKLNDAMKPYLYNLKERFTEYRIENILTLKSKYAFRLYEWLKSFHTPEATCYLSKLKDLFATKYKESYDIIRFCLEPAIEEINAKTDLSVSYTKKKSGRVVSAVVFTIHEKKDLSCLEDSATSEPEGKDNTIYVLTHIKADGTPETIEIKGSAEAQRLIDDRGFEQGRTFISKKVGDNVENATPEFVLK